jgi:hypothetical protein
MPTEIHSGVSGSGHILFTDAFYFFKVRTHVTNFGSSQPMDLLATYGRNGKVGWWTTYEDISTVQPDGFPAGQYECDVFWIVFKDQSFRVLGSNNSWDPSGFDGFAFNLYPGVVVDFQFAYP